ncbi:MAG: ATP-binding protein, partial [Phycisphaerae bacterium]
LAESKENYQLLFDNINDAVFVLEYNWKDKQTGRFLVVNAVACERYGYTQEEFLTMRPQDIDDPAASALIPEALRKLAEDGYTVWEGLHHTKSGRIIPVEISNVLFDYHGQPTILATVRDISERKQVEEKIMEVTRRLQLATNAGRLGIWEWDITTNALIWDERMLELYGLTPATFINVLESWIKCLHPDDCLTAQSVLHTAVASGCDYDSEFRVVHPDGTVRHLRAHAAIVLDPAGHPLRMVGFNQDITEQKQAQQALQLAKDAAERANSAKDEFLAKLSHELRTPLTPVLLAVADLEDEPGLPDNVRSDLAMIHRNIDLEAHLINDLLDVNRIMQGKLTLHRETLDLHQKIHDALSYVNRDLVKKQIKLTLQLSAQQTDIDGDPARVQQIFWNLLSNAIKFTPEAGAVSVRTSNTPDNQVLVEISDTGLGIKPEMLARLFEPFQQGEQQITRRFGGLGLGLAICKTLVDMHGGSIVATSTGLDQGSTFTVQFPVVKLVPRPPVPPTTVPKTTVPSQAKQRILFVEDHPDTALLVVRFLTHWGYKVDQVDTVAAALQHAEAGFDLLITDLGLPDGSGYDVMRKLSEKGPVKALVTSGFGMDIDQQRSRDAGFHAHLTKPVDFRELHGLLQKLLGT